MYVLAEASDKREPGRTTLAGHVAPRGGATLQLHGAMAYTNGSATPDGHKPNRIERSFPRLLQNTFPQIGLPVRHSSTRAKLRGTP